MNKSIVVLLLCVSMMMCQSDFTLTYDECIKHTNMHDVTDVYLSVQGFYNATFNVTLFSVDTKKNILPNCFSTKDECDSFEYKQSNLPISEYELVVCNTEPKNNTSTYKIDFIVSCVGCENSSKYPYDSFSYVSVDKAFYFFQHYLLDDPYYTPTDSNRNYSYIGMIIFFIILCITYFLMIFIVSFIFTCIVLCIKHTIRKLCDCISSLIYKEKDMEVLYV